MMASLDRLAYWVALPPNAQNRNRELYSIESQKIVYGQEIDYCELFGRFYEDARCCRLQPVF